MIITTLPTTRSNWSKSEIKMDKEDDSSIKKPIMLELIHNIPHSGNINTIEAAAENWFIRTREYSSKSLIDYINSKTPMSGFRAMSVEEFNKKFNKS